MCDGRDCPSPAQADPADISGSARRGSGSPNKPAQPQKRSGRTNRVPLIRVNVPGFGWPPQSHLRLARSDADACAKVRPPSPDSPAVHLVMEPEQSPGTLAVRPPQVAFRSLLQPELSDTATTARLPPGP